MEEKMKKILAIIFVGIFVVIILFAAFIEKFITNIRNPHTLGTIKFNIQRAVIMQADDSQYDKYAMYKEIALDAFEKKHYKRALHYFDLLTPMYNEISPYLETGEYRPYNAYYPIFPYKAYCCLYLKQKERAISEYNRFFDSNMATHPQDFIFRGWFYKQLGFYNLAIQDFLHSAEISTAYAALTLEQRSLEKNLSRDSFDSYIVEAHFEIAQTYALQNKETEACSWLNKIASHKPYHDIARKEIEDKSRFFLFDNFQSYNSYDRLKSLACYKEFLAAIQ